MVPAKTYKQVMWLRRNNPPAKAYWDAVCKAVRERDGWKCQVCRKKGWIVHHRTYRNLFNEHKHLGDLMLVCDRCHRKIHGIPWWKK